MESNTLRLFLNCLFSQKRVVVGYEYVIHLLTLKWIKSLCCPLFFHSFLLIRILFCGLLVLLSNLLRAFPSPKGFRFHLVYLFFVLHNLKSHFHFFILSQYLERPKTTYEVSNSDVNLYKYKRLLVLGTVCPSYFSRSLSQIKQQSPDSGTVDLLNLSMFHGRVLLQLVGCYHLFNQFLVTHGFPDPLFIFRLLFLLVLAVRSF